MQKNREFTLKPTSDEDLISYLHKLVFPADHIYNTINEVYHWIVYDKDMKIPAGFCTGTKINSDTMFLARAGLLDFACGNGLHKRMLIVRERKARKLGLKQIITYTKMDNMRSNHNLQKCGYMIYGPENPYADEDCLYWIKYL